MSSRTTTGSGSTLSTYERVVLEAVSRDWMPMEAIEQLSALSARNPDDDPLEVAIAHGMLTRDQVARITAELTPDMAPPAPDQIPGSSPMGLPSRTPPTLLVDVSDDEEMADTLPQSDLRLLSRSDDWLPFPLGPYILLERISHGGFGTVYLAEQVGVRRQVAVKVLEPTAAIRPDVVARFMREAEALGAIDHPNVVRVIEVGRSQGLHFCAMELLRGSELRDLIDEGPAAPRRVARIGSQIANGLAQVHAYGLVHRDIKPENIIQARKPERAVLVDFGLVIDPTSSRLTQEGMLIGTPAYMAPEQFRQQEADTRSDIYSLGITLYELLCGEAPHLATKVAQLMYEKFEVEPAWLHERADVPQDLSAVVHKALEIHPDDRYQTADELAADLERFLAGEPVHARPVDALGRLLRWIRRKPLTALATLAVALGLGTIGGLYVRGGRATEDAAANEARRAAAERRTAKMAREARARQLGVVLGDVSRAMARLRRSLDPDSPGLDPAGALALTGATLERIERLGPPGLIEDPRASQLAGAREDLRRLEAVAIVLGGMRERYAAADAILAGVPAGSTHAARAAGLRALIQLDAIGLERIIWRRGCPRTREVLRTVEADVVRTGKTSRETRAALGHIDRAARKHPELELERARLLLHVGLPTKARERLEATEVGAWRARHRARYYRAVQLLLLALHRGGGEDAAVRFDELFDEVHRDAIDPNVEATVVDTAPALYTGCALLLERYLDTPATQRAALDPRLQRVEAVLRNPLISSAELPASRRFPSLRWTFGVVRLINGAPRGPARRELLRALEVGHTPTRDRRYADLPALAWILEDAFLMRRAGK